MKSTTKIFLSVVLAALSILCVVLFLMADNNVLLIVYNPVTNKTEQFEVNNGEPIANYINAPQIEGYSFINNYYSTDFSNSVDSSAKIAGNTTVVLGYCKNITDIKQATNGVVGVKFIGNLSQEKLSTLLESKYKYLDLSQATITGDFLSYNSSLQTLILPSGNVRNINNYTDLKNVYASDNTSLENSFNNCPKLENLNINGCLQILNSFNNCRQIKTLNIPQSLTAITDSFKDSQLETITNQSQHFLCENGLLYQRVESGLILKKSIKKISVVNPNSNTIKIDDNAFFEHSNIKSLNINAKVETIGKNAFANSTLQDINITQNNVLTIKEKAFINCLNLQSVNFGKGIETIQDYAFYNCGVNKLTFENSVISSLGEYAFACSENLTSVKFSDRQVTLNKGCFAGCKNLLSVSNLNTKTLPEKIFESCASLSTLSNISSVETIQNYAFINCKQLTDITELSTTKTIGVGAFENCINIVQAKFLELETISKSMFKNCQSLEECVSAQALTEFNGSAFDGCNKLKNLSFISNNFMVENGVVYNKNKTHILYYLPTKQDSTFVIDSGVTTIENKYLSQNQYLKQILTNSANFCEEEGVLFSADKQTLICYPANKTDASYVVPKTTRTILKYAFSNSKNLTQLTIPAEVTKLENGFIWQNSTLTTLWTSFIGETINNSQTSFLGWFFGAVNYLQNNQFVPSTLKDIVVNNQSTFGDYCFYDCNKLLSVNLVNTGVMQNYMFYECSSLQTVSIGKSLESIKEYALYNCQNLISINFVLNEDLTKEDVAYSALLKTPNSNLKANVFHTSTITENQLTNFSKCFYDKQNNWAWKTPKEK